MNYKKIFKRETKVIAYVVICLTLVVIGTSYALFLQVNNNSNNQVVEAGDLTIVYSEGNTITAEQEDDDKNCLAPKSEDEGEKSGCLFTFSITNNGTLPMQYNLLIYNNTTENKDNTFDNYQHIKYSLTKKNTKEGSNVENVQSKADLSEAENYTSNKPEETQTTKKKILEDAIIKPKESFSFSLRIWIDEDAPTSIIGKKIDLALDVKGFVSETEDILADKVSGGEYVIYRPYQTSYLVSKDDTGHTEDQMINPSELTLWRVLKKNNKEVELISDSVSSVEVTFKGQTGYKKFIKTLKGIAKSYEDGNYTTSSRIPGYSNQTDEITENLSTETCGSVSTGIQGWKSDNQACGDMEYQTDENQMKTALSDLTGKTGETPKNYWLASRWYGGTTGKFSGRCINTSGTHSELPLYENNQDKESSAAIRPIVTLKSGIKVAGGTGTQKDPYILSSFAEE